MTLKKKALLLCLFMGVTVVIFILAINKIFYFTLNKGLQFFRFVQITYLPNEVSPFYGVVNTGVEAKDIMLGVVVKNKKKEEVKYEIIDTVVKFTILPGEIKIIKGKFDTLCAFFDLTKKKFLYVDIIKRRDYIGWTNLIKQQKDTLYLVADRGVCITSRQLFYKPKDTVFIFLHLMSDSLNRLVAFPMILWDSGLRLHVIEPRGFKFKKILKGSLPGTVNPIHEMFHFITNLPLNMPFLLYKVISSDKTYIIQLVKKLSPIYWICKIKKNIYTVGVFPWEEKEFIPYQRETYKLKIALPSVLPSQIQLFEIGYGDQFVDFNKKENMVNSGVRKIFFSIIVKSIEDKDEK